MAKKRRPERSAQTTVSNGAKDFRELAYESEPEWSVYAVESPLKKVAEQLAKLLNATICSRDILSKPIPAKGHDVARITPLVSVQDSPWTVAYRTVGFFISAEAKAADQQAQALSKSLKTRAISYHREAVSGESACEMFDNGKDLGEDVTEEEALDDKSIDILLRTLGIYIPACLMYSKEDRIILEVKLRSAKMVTGAWLVQCG